MCFGWKDWTRAICEGGVIMVLAGDPPEVYYGFDECGTCHAELDNGRHICMSDFTVPSDVLFGLNDAPDSPEEYQIIRW